LIADKEQKATETFNEIFYLYKRNQ